MVKAQPNWEGPGSSVQDTVLKICPVSTKRNTKHSLKAAKRLAAAFTHLSVVFWGYSSSSADNKENVGNLLFSYLALHLKSQAYFLI